MKTKNRVLLLVIVALIMALLAIPGYAVAQATKAEFVFTPIITGIVDFGDWMTLPSGNIRVRGWILEEWDEVSEPRACGTNTIVINANWDSNETGPVWGTWHVVNEYGTWEGTYTGVMGADGSKIRGVAHGTGELEGLKYSINCDYTVEPASCSGQILNPHGP
jgi:hypothetical protein